MIVDEDKAHELAEAHGLPPIEVDAALFGEDLSLAEAVLTWIDDEEWRLRAAHGLLEGRKRYQPSRMLRNYARKNRTGRWKTLNERRARS